MVVVIPHIFTSSVCNCSELHSLNAMNLVKLCFNQGALLYIDFSHTHNRVGCGKLIKNRNLI